jgi:hypothetical protein
MKTKTMTYRNCGLSRYVSLKAWINKVTFNTFVTCVIYNITIIARQTI